MDIKFILNIIQLIMSFGIVGFVIIQQQESGLYSNTSNINRTRRGMEKLVYNLTIVFGIIFIGATLASLLV